MNYDFSTLNDKDLEELALDLLNAELNLGLQSFKVGKDGGIDLRCSTPENNNEIVVQVKHYLKSGDSKLIKDFKEKELPKIQQLTPAPIRYIIVTSIGLSNTQKDDLKKAFEPYIQSSNDIFGKDDLNTLLRKHQNIEKKHFKLWFSSSEILTGILNNAIEGRSKSYLQQASKKIPLYVITKNFDDANKILEKEKLLLISGDPGIGKTTLADILLLSKGKQDYKIYIINSIRDAEDVISVNEEEKQVFYFDDFLGEVYYEILTGSQKENEISQFLNRIVNEPNKYLILSTRTVILEQAKNKSEKIKRAKLDVAKYEINLSDYSKYEKAKILYNHLYFRGIENEFINKIIEDKFYCKIISHKSYTPRLIEFFTDEYRLKDLDSDRYKDFILHNLNYPEEIWKDSINNQISYLDKCFLYNLFTFRNTIVFEVSDIQRSFDKRLSYEMQVNNQQIKTNQFHESVKSLMNSFIYINMRDVDYKYEDIRFINPSISDFILGDLKSNEDQKVAILNSILFIEQLEIFDTTKTGITLSKQQQSMLLERIKSNLIESIHPWHRPIEILYLNTIVRLCSETNYDDLFLQILNNLNFDKPISNNSELIYTLQNIYNAPKSIAKIQANFYEIMSYLVINLDDYKLASVIPELFEQYGYDYKEYIDSENGNKSITDLIVRVIEKSEKDIYDSNKNLISKQNELNDFVYEEVDDIKTNLIERLNPNLMIEIPRQLSEEEIQEQIETNSQNEIASENRIQELINYSENQPQNEDE